ncbi:hypothetical protein GNP81_06095 [Aliivibrio fischeri]|uniref:hypothetical protein n=1 Tax=Aliivibrio fischeri TaxID=668 RepID=UPI0012D9A899|nr:hypothetical protein [Aliivibrio fischeri]MUK62981.1 hypothetical protein [Aliivibrio fischeri]MUL20402.1 hypothetical protein [Aliivibrio fischeri]MUL24177.1 hypothetical protein [Aliivibrio fischeri]
MMSVFVLFLNGCSSSDPLTMQIDPVNVKAQMYTYTDLNKNQSELWEITHQYLMNHYEQHQTEIRVMDRANASFIGKGIVKWKISPTEPLYCYSAYDFRFMARDNKARLQLKLLPGVPSLSGCHDWELPSEYGYKQILDKFEAISTQLNHELIGED